MEEISESDCIKKYYKYYHGYVEIIANSLDNVNGIWTVMN